MSEESKRKDRPGDQPMPTESGGPVMHDLVRDDLLNLCVNRLGVVLLAGEIEQRKQLGIVRYGRPLRAFNGRDALRDAVDEAVDLLVYIRQALEEAAARRDEVVRSHLAGVYRDMLRSSSQLAWAREIRRASGAH